MARQLVSCASVRTHLHAFADGELRGDMLRAVSQHVDDCDGCSAAVVEIGDLGNMLRFGVSLEAEPPDLAGLADGVVSRVRAEERESWRGLLDRATDDLHWVMVGVGSVAAAFVSALVVSVVVQSGVGQNADSLAAILNTLATEPPALGRTTIVPAGFGASVGDGTMFVSLAEVNDDGHVMSVESVSNLDKKDAAILGEMRRMRFEEQQDRRMTDPSGRRFVWVVSSTEVRANIL